jgi:hypothetical protein
VRHNGFAIIAALVMRKRRLWIALIVLLAVAALGAALFVRAYSPPEAARLLPAGEAVIYVNLKPLRMATDFGKEPVIREPEYDEFIKATGFQFERDLDELAIVVHSPEEVAGADPARKERRFSEVFVGRFDATKLKHYLHKIAADVEMYRDNEVFVVPMQGRTVRVAILSMDSVAVSNSADTQNIQFMIDRYYRGALPIGMPWMLRTQYKHVPFGSAAWAILQLKTPNGRDVYLPFPDGVNLQLPRNTTTVASIRYTGNVQMRVEAITGDDKQAEKLHESLSTFLNLFRSVQENMGTQGADQDVKKFFDSLDVEQDRNSVVLKADLQPGFLKKLVSEPAAPVAPAAVPESKPATSGKPKP